MGRGSRSKRQSIRDLPLRSDVPGLLAVHIEPSAPPVGPGMLEELPEDDVSGGQSLAELAGEAPDPHDEGWNVVDGMDEAGNSSSQAG